MEADAPPNSSKLKALRAVELFSGVGGWSYAAQRSLGEIEVVLAIDVSTNCNAIYETNFGRKPKQINIADLKVQDLENTQVWLMSPPCQPHSRQGRREDCDDARSAAFLRICQLIREIPPEIICLENVVGFAESRSCELLLHALNTAGFSFLKSYHLSPTMIGVPNSRPRFYLCAVRTHHDQRIDELIHDHHETWPLPDARLGTHTKKVADFLEGVQSKETLSSFHFLPLSLLTSHRAWTLDIVDSHSTLTSCFTRSYGRFARGTGSVLLLSGKALQREAPHDRSFNHDWHLAYLVQDDNTTELQRKFRYFTPREIANFLGFPPEFSLPDSVPQRAQWAALGNSLHVDAAAAVLQVALRHHRLALSDHDRGSQDNIKK